MDEKKIEKEIEQPVVKKKAYTPPEIIKYGKLNDLTAGGTNPQMESGGQPARNPKG